MAKTTIAILDDYQNLSQPPFSQLDSSKYSITTFKDTLLPYNHKDTPESVKDELVHRHKSFDIISTMRERTPFPKDLIMRLPNLKLLLTSGIRDNSLDLPTFRHHAIPVAGTIDLEQALDSHNESAKNQHPSSTTQHTIALILSLARDIPGSGADLCAGLWQTTSATSLSNKTLGIVGLGKLGVATARIMSLAFGMKVIAWSPNLTQEIADERALAAGMLVQLQQEEIENSNSWGKTFRVVTRQELFATADVVSVHLVLSERSRGLITAADIGMMEMSAFFVNTSRGPIVVEEDLLDALRTGGIGGAAVDVFDLEPLPADSEWRSELWGKNGRSRVIATPHMGYVEAGHVTDWYRQQVENIQQWERGESLQILLA